MTTIVPADQIEANVGARRHHTLHLGRAMSTERTVYILHSQECKDSGIDLRDCEYSVALDAGIDITHWVEDETRILSVSLLGELLGADLTDDVDLVGWADR